MRNFIKKFKIIRYKPDASSIYQAIVTQSREVQFYTECGVPDTPTGRFELISLHSFVFMKRLKVLGGEAEALSQALFDYMFADIDINLREMGVGDIGVGKKIKSLAAAYYGRIKSYETALKKGEHAIKESLTRNLYCDEKPTEQQLSAMTVYILALSEVTNKLNLQQISALDFIFPLPLDEKAG
ncbi:MAG: phage tail protein [Rhodospirillaceae bacterium]|nr:phage tail protein [Rhodospirillaceae bacterium]